MQPSTNKNLAMLHVQIVTKNLMHGNLLKIIYKKNIHNIFWKVHSAPFCAVSKKIDLFLRSYTYSLCFWCGLML